MGVLDDTERLLDRALGTYGADGSDQPSTASVELLRDSPLAGCLCATCVHALALGRPAQDDDRQRIEWVIGCGRADVASALASRQARRHWVPERLVRCGGYSRHPALPPQRLSERL